MADQEKQQLLEALEEKQRSREEKAQQQEKMLQQLKAGIPGVLTWGLGFFRTLLTFHVSIPPGTIKGNGGEDAGWKPGYGESHAVTLQHAQASGRSPEPTCTCHGRIRQEADLRKAAVEVEEKKRLEQRMLLRSDLSCDA